MRRRIHRVDYDNRWTGDNWLGDWMTPGTGLTMHSNDEYDDRCQIFTRITLDDGSVYEPLENYCGTGAIYGTDAKVYRE